MGEPSRGGYSPRRSILLAASCRAEDLNPSWVLWRIPIRGKKPGPFQALLAAVDARRRHAKRRGRGAQAQVGLPREGFVHVAHARALEERFAPRDLGRDGADRVVAQPARLLDRGDEAVAGEHVE